MGLFDIIDTVKEALGGAVENTDIAQNIQDLGENATSQAGDVADQAAQSAQEATDQVTQSIEDSNNR